MISEVQRIHLYNMAQKMNQALKIDRNQINAEQIIDISHALDLYELIKKQSSIIQKTMLKAL